MDTTVASILGALAGLVGSTLAVAAARRAAAARPQPVPVRVRDEARRARRVHR